MFAKLLNILDPQLNFSLTEVNKYMESLNYLITNCQTGTSIPMEENSLRMYVPYVRALEYMKVFTELKGFTQEELASLKDDIDVFIAIQTY